MIETAFSR